METIKKEYAENDVKKNISRKTFIIYCNTSKLEKFTSL